MGILNVTPDSFSDGGMYPDLKSALAQTEKMLAEGADIIDIGAESTRPNAVKIAQDEEISRILPIVSAIRKLFPKAIVSVDTYKPQVAKLCIEAGADIINDVVSDSADGFPMARVAASLKCPLVITHNSRNAKKSDDFFASLLTEISAKIETAIAFGVSKENIIIDPGVGFGKTAEQNFEIVSRLGELRFFDCDILLGVSRKSMFADIAGADFADRDEATSAVSAITTFLHTADILRVHDVKKNLTAIKTALKIKSLWTK